MNLLATSSQLTCRRIDVMEKQMSIIYILHTQSEKMKKRWVKFYHKSNKHMIEVKQIGICREVAWWWHIAAGLETEDTREVYSWCWMSQRSAPPYPLFGAPSSESIHKERGSRSWRKEATTGRQRRRGYLRWSWSEEMKREKILANFWYACDMFLSNYFSRWLWGRGSDRVFRVTEMRRRQ
jgi:hypothetical protein